MLIKKNTYTVCTKLIAYNFKHTFFYVTSIRKITNNTQNVE